MRRNPRHLTISCSALPGDAAGAVRSGEGGKPGSLVTAERALRRSFPKRPKRLSYRPAREVLKEVSLFQSEDRASLRLAPLPARYDPDLESLEPPRNTEQDCVIGEGRIAVRASGNVRNAGPTISLHGPRTVERERVQAPGVQQTRI